MKAISSNKIRILDLGNVSIIQSISYGERFIQQIKMIDVLSNDVSIFVVNVFHGLR